MNSTPCMIKILNKVDMEGTYLNIKKKKTTYEKLTVNRRVNGEKLKAFPAKIWNKTFSPFLFNIVLEGLATDKEKK